MTAVRSFLNSAVELMLLGARAKLNESPAATPRRDVIDAEFEVKS